MPEETPILPTETEPGIATEVLEEVSTDRPWNVIVWDDPINLMSYVVYVFQRVFGLSEQVATVKMMEVHQDGRSLVCSTDREQAEFYVGRLHVFGLQATMEQPDT